MNKGVLDFEPHLHRRRNGNEACRAVEGRRLKVAVLLVVFLALDVSRVLVWALLG